MKLIFALLRHTEKKDSLEFTAVPEINGFTPQQVHYHVGLCEQANLLTVRSISGADAPYPQYVIGQLTWNGHEALEKNGNGN